MPQVELTHTYEDLLRDYLVGGQETTLLRAYELGRELLDQGFGLLDVVHLHHRAVAVVDNELPALPRDTFATRSQQVLAEALGAFEMALRGFRDSNAALQRMADELEGKVAQRTAELQRSLAELQATDAERRRLLERIVTAQEEERRRIAEDVHDDSIQAMAAVGLRLDILRHTLPEAADTEQLERLGDAVAESIDRLRTLVFELRPPTLDHEGLASALSIYLSETMTEAGCSWDVDDRLEQEPAASTRGHVYRLAQEALTNVRKHARANHVTIVLTTQDDHLCAEIHDDGVGFDASAEPGSRPGHLGLTSMRERAGMIGGAVTVDSAPSRGTTVTVRVPLAGGSSREADRW